MKKIYTVYDQKSEAYLQPFFMDTDGQATRAFSDLINDPQHEFGKHSEDYTLFNIGTYDESTAQIVCGLSPISLGKGLEFTSARSLAPIGDDSNRRPMPESMFKLSAKKGK